MSTSTTKGVNAMPAPHTARAPTFSGRTSELLEFFDQFESLAVPNGLTDEEKCKFLLRYVDRPIKLLWITLPGYDTFNYKDFKDSILAEYPGASKGVKYGLRDLEAVVLSPDNADISTETELIQYYHKFRTIAVWLVANNKISKQDRDHYFWKGLPRTIRQLIDRRLELLDPTNYSRDGPAAYETVAKAGRYVLSDDAFDSEMTNPAAVRPRSSRTNHDISLTATDEHRDGSRLRSSLLPTDDEDEDELPRRKKDAPREVQTKKVTFAAPLPFSNAQYDEIEELGRKMHSLDIADCSYSALYNRLALLAPTVAHAWAAPSSRQFAHMRTTFSNPQSHLATMAALLCYGCGEAHILRDCPVIEGYIKAGQVVRINGAVTFPDGRRVRRHPGTNTLQGSIDEYYRLQATPAAQTGSAAYPTRTEFRRDSPPHMAQAATNVLMVDEPAGYLFNCAPVADPPLGKSYAVDSADICAITRSKSKVAEQAAAAPTQPSPPPIARSSLPERPPPAFTYESKAATPDAAKRVYSNLLSTPVANLTIADLLSISPDLRREAVDHCRTQRIPHSAAGDTLAASAVPHVEHATPLREIAVVLNGVHHELALLDEGSEIVLIREDVRRALDAPTNTQMGMTMRTANGGAQPIDGCVEMLEIDVAGIKSWAHAYVVPCNAPYRLLLGRPWQRLVRLARQETDDAVLVTVHDPTNLFHSRTVPTSVRPFPAYPKTQESYSISVSPRRQPAQSSLTLTNLADHLLQDTFQFDPVRHVLAYKKVANRVKPVATTMPQHARIVRRFPEDPLSTLPTLSPRPPDFTPGKRLTQERINDLGIFTNDFLWPEEQKLAAQVLLNNELGLAWDETEKGRFRDDYFPPVVIPTIEHTPWVHRQPPIPPGIRDEVIQLIKSKIASGIYEPSNSSYQSKWFCVAKKNGSVRIVHDLQPLNAVTVKDAATLPYVEHFAEQSAGRSIYTMMDLFVGFDHRALAEESRDVTTFQTPLGTFRLTSLPMGWTDSPAIFQNDVAFILQAEIDVAPNFQDDINVLGPRTRYEQANGLCEVISANPGIRRFVWEHCTDVNRVLHRLKRAGATVSAKKLFMCQDAVIVVGQTCNYDGRVPDTSKVAKIQHWPAPCTTRTEVRGFLGVTGTVRNWIKDYASISRPLVELTRESVPFDWQDSQQDAMDRLKAAVVACPAIRPIDYTCSRPVTLAVDSSQIAVGFILFQDDEKGRRCPSRFGSITWNDREARYSQAKIELYGLFRALKSIKVWIIGLKNFIIEVDAKYIKGMINNPDIQPNAAMNRWIAGILTFDFTLKHVPASRHLGPDGLSRRRWTTEDGIDVEETSEEVEDWLDDVLDEGMRAEPAGQEDAPCFTIARPHFTDTATHHTATAATLSYTITPKNRNKKRNKKNDRNEDRGERGIVSEGNGETDRTKGFGAVDGVVREPQDGSRDTLDEVLACGLWVAGKFEEERFFLEGEGGERALVLSALVDEAMIPTSDKAKRHDEHLHAVKDFLHTLSIPSNLSDTQRSRFVKQAANFFVASGKLWRREPNGRHQQVIFGSERLRILHDTHDALGHKGYYPTRRTIADRFWWPTINDDVAWYVRTCHQCQTRAVDKVLLPPTVATPAPLFRKAYIDSMYMPTAQGYTYIVQARCSLTGWPEWRKLKRETGRTLGAFIFEEILCRWGGLEEIVTDNGTPFVAALDWLAEKYHIRHIRISAYNSRANGIVERSHRTIRDSLVKACDGDITQWPALVSQVFWADRVTTRKSTGHSPYYMAHGVEPLLPLDIVEATFLAPPISAKQSETELLAARALQLAKRDGDLAVMHERILRSRFASIAEFERRFAHSIKDHDFAPGSLVLVQNRKIEAESNAKCRPRYFGPMVVVSRARNGSYRLAEADGSVSKLKFAAFRLVPYHARSLTRLSVTEFVDRQDLAGIAEEVQE